MVIEKEREGGKGRGRETETERRERPGSERGGEGERRRRRGQREGDERELGRRCYRYIGGDPLRPARAAAVLTKDHRPAATAPAGRRSPAASAQIRRPVRLPQLSGRLEPAVRVRLPLLWHHSCHRRQQRLAGGWVQPPRRRRV